MENQITEYKLVEGYREAFEKELNQLSKLGWILCGQVNSVKSEIGVTHSILMSRLASQ